MPRIDYYAIEEKIKEKLEADSTLQGIQVSVEGEMNFQAGHAPWIGIYLDRRDPSPRQALDAGMSTRYNIRFTVWCWTMSLESVQSAIHDRDDLVSKVEVALMRDRSLGDMVDMMWLQGGEMPSGRLENESGQAVYLSGAEIILLVETETNIS